MDLESHYGSYDAACEDSARYIVKNNRRPILIVGNGPSLTTIDYRRMPKDPFVLRVNNFYFEDRYYVGENVDALYMGGNPKVIQSYTNTLMTVLTRREYSVRTFLGRTDNIFRINANYFPVLDVKKAFITNRDISNFMTLAHMPPGILPTSGVLAIFAAISFGFKNIYVAGMDMYAGASRYAFPVGKNHAKIVGIKEGATGYFEEFHAQETDVKAMAFAISMPGISIQTICPGSPITSMLPLAPEKGDATLFALPKPVGYVNDFIPVPSPPAKPQKSAKTRFLDVLERNLPSAVVTPGKNFLRHIGIIQSRK